MRCFFNRRARRFSKAGWERRCACAQVLEAAPQDGQAHYQAHYLMALTKAASHRPDDALAHYDAALAVNPAMTEAWNPQHRKRLCTHDGNPPRGEGPRGFTVK